jgi:hypothetical protein
MKLGDVVVVEVGTPGLDRVDAGEERVDGAVAVADVHPGAAAEDGGAGRALGIEFAALLVGADRAGLRGDVFRLRLPAADNVTSMSTPRALDGPIGLVGAGYIGHLFAQQFALAGYKVRAWSPGGSGETLRERLRGSLATLVEIGAVEASKVDAVVSRVSAHDDLPTALGPCSAVMESIIEDA